MLRLPLLSRFACCLLVSVMSLVWQSPRRYPGHTSTWHAPAEWSPCPWVSPAHASAAASWWLWTPYYWALHSLRKTDGERSRERDDGQGRDDEIIVEESVRAADDLFNDDFHLSEEAFFFFLPDRYLPSQSNRANTTSHTWSDSSTLATVRATCFMVTERRREGSTDREIQRLWDWVIEAQVTQSSS